MLLGLCLPVSLTLLGFPGALVEAAEQEARGRRSNLPLSLSLTHTHTHTHTHTDTHVHTHTHTTQNLCFNSLPPLPCFISQTSTLIQMFFFWEPGENILFIVWTKPAPLRSSNQIWF